MQPPYIYMYSLYGICSNRTEFQIKFSMKTKTTNQSENDYNLTGLMSMNALFQFKSNCEKTIEYMYTSECWTGCHLFLSFMGRF